MPQMAPLNWLALFFMFIIIFMFFNSLNYFSFMYKSKILQQKKTTNLISWKW